MSSIIMLDYFATGEGTTKGIWYDKDADNVQFLEEVQDQLDIYLHMGIEIYSAELVLADEKLLERVKCINPTFAELLKRDAGGLKISQLFHFNLS